MAIEISNGKKTVKLYSSVNRGKPMFQLSYQEGGKRVQRNFSDKAEAKRVARSIVGELTQNGAAVDNLSTAELESYVAARKALASNYALHVAVTEHAQAVSRLGKSSLLEAVEFFLRHHRSDQGRVPLAVLSEQFVASRNQSGLSPKHVGNCRRHTQQLAEAFSHDSLSDLSTEKLDHWLGNLKNVGAVSKNQMIKTFVSLGNWSEKRGHLIKGANPFKGMIRYKEPKEPISLLSPKQMSQLLQTVPDRVKAFIALGAFAGLRAAEVQRLDWSDIDLNRGYVTVDASKAKTRRRRLVPILDNLKLWLAPHKQEFGPICIRKNPQAVARRYCKGFKWAKNGLRHSYISSDWP